MKKKSKSRIVNVFNTVFNVRSWTDFDRLRAFTLYLSQGIRAFLIPQKKQLSPKESSTNFATAIAHLKLNEDELFARQRGLYRLSVIMCVVAMMFFSYALYHLVFGGFKAVIVSLVLMFIALVLAFRYHFWYFQIKERKLGCTFREWYRQGFLGKKS